MNTDINFNVMSVREFAKKINKPASTIYEWIRKSTIPDNCTKRVGKTIFVKVPEMHAFLNS